MIKKISLSYFFYIYIYICSAEALLKKTSLSYDFTLKNHVPRFYVACRAPVAENQSHEQQCSMRCLYPLQQCTGLARPRKNWSGEEHERCLRHCTCPKTASSTNPDWDGHDSNMTRLRVTFPASQITVRSQPSEADTIQKPRVAVSCHVLIKAPRDSVIIEHKTSRQNAAYELAKSNSPRLIGIIWSFVITKRIRSPRSRSRLRLRSSLGPPGVGRRFFLLI